MKQQGRDRSRRRRGIIYIRVSMAREEMYSPEQQEWSARDYCKRENIEVVDVVYDLDLTGREFAKRKIAKIIERVRRNEADTVVVWQWSRFGRNLMGSRVNIAALEEAGGELRASTQDIDTTTSAGKYTRDHFLALAEYQSNMIGDTWRESHDRRRRDGLPHTGEERFGYRHCPECVRKSDDPKTTEYHQFKYCEACKGILIKDPVPGAALKEVYERWTDENEPMAALSLEMARRGIRSRYGTMMDSDQWFAVMDSGFAAGLLRGRSDTTKKLTRYTPDQYDIWDRGAHEAWIPLDLWERYKRKRLRRGKPRELVPKYSVSSLMRCWCTDNDGALCARSMTAAQVDMSKTRGYPKFTTFICPRKRIGACPGVSVSLRRVEPFVLAWLKEHASGEEAGRTAMVRAARADEDFAALELAEKELKGLKAERKRLVTGYRKGIIPEEDYTDELDTVSAQIALLDGRVEELSQSVFSNKIPPADAFDSLLDLWDDMRPDERRAALGHVIRYIRVIKTPGKQENKLEIVPKWLPDPYSASGAIPSRGRQPTLAKAS